MAETEPKPKPKPNSVKKPEKPFENDEDAVTSYSDYICEYRAPTKFDFAAIAKKTTGQTYEKTASETLNLCGKQLATGKRCMNKNVGACPNTGCSVHYGWQDEVEGFRLRTF